MSLEPFDIEQVECVFYVFYAVDMAVDVNIIIICVDSPYEFGSLAHPCPSGLVYGARLVLLHIFQYQSVVDTQYVNRLPRHRINHSPDALAITADPAISTRDGEVTSCEILHSALHPRLNGELVVGFRHDVHLDDKPRQYPCAVHRPEHVHAISAVVAVEVGSIEHVVAQMSHEETA